MQTTRPQGRSLALPVVRWGARILSAGILLFWGWFLIAHLLSEEGLGPRVWQDYAGLTAMVVALVGLALAWKWELLGGFMALAAYVILGVVNWRALGGPFILWPITAVMFLTSAWLGAARRNDQATRVP
jgi:hypothetical protein